MTKPLTIAVSKGYLFNETIAILKKVGIEFELEGKESRKLFTFDKTGTIKLLQIRPWDAPVYVEQGVADLGVVGLDVLIEKEDQVTRLIDLGIGGCSLVLASDKPYKPDALPQYLRVATKFTNATSAYFKKKGLNVKLLKLNGSIELAPLIGLSDIICDLTATGTTLKEHNLTIIDTVFSSTAQLVGNQSALRFRYDEITTLVNKIKEVI